MLSCPESVSWKQPRKLSGPDILFCRRQNRGRKRLRNTLKVPQPESGCTGFMQLIKEGGGWRCRGKRPSTRGREENASSGEGAAGVVPPAQGSGPSSCPAHSEQWDCQRDGCLTGEDSGVSSTDQEARSHRADSRGPSSVKTVQ